MSATLSSLSQIPTIIPMFPNGTPGSKRKWFRSSIPRSPLLPPGNQPPIPFVYAIFSLTRVLTDHIQQISMLGTQKGDEVEMTC